jgi:hypothetical protein
VNKIAVVLGAPRSMTSGVAKGMHLAGFGMGGSMLEANRSNPFGHYEHTDLIALNDIFLSSCGGSWDDPPAWPDPPPEHLVWCAVEYIAARGPAPWGCKDPRMVLVWPIWEEAFNRSGLDVIKIKVLRAPEYSAESLCARDGCSMTASRLLIAEYRERLERIA